MPRTKFTKNRKQKLLRKLSLELFASVRSRKVRLQSTQGTVGLPHPPPSLLALTMEHPALVSCKHSCPDTQRRATTLRHSSTAGWKAPVEATRVRMCRDGAGKPARTPGSSRLFFIAAVKQARLNIWLAIPRSHKRSRRDWLVRRARIL